MSKKKILIIGSTGLLGLNFVYKNLSNFDIYCNIHKKKIKDKKIKTFKLNFNNKRILLKQIKTINPEIILNCSGYTDILECEKNKKRAFKENFLNVKILVKVANTLKIKLIHISTDHIFDGSKNGLYKENDPKKPLNYYAKTKLYADKLVVQKCKKYLIIRTNFFGWGSINRNSFSDYIIKNLSLKNKIYLNDDIYFTPMYIGNLIECINILINKNKTGIFNISSDTCFSKFSFAIKLAKYINLDHSLILKNTKSTIPKPKNMCLSNLKVSKIVSKSLLKISNNFLNFKNDFKDSYINKFYDYIPYGRHYLFKEDINAVRDVFLSSNLTQGPKIEEFEEKISKYVGSKYAVAVSSCSAGLHLACIAAGLNSNNKLITSTNTFVSSANAALHCNSKVEFIDIEPSTGNISLPLIKDKILKDKKVKVIMPVHFGGLPCDMKKIKTYTKNKNKIFIIEDAAHALGAKYKDGLKVGSCKYSDMTVFSFHPVKSIASGEGGIITTNDIDIYNKLKSLRSHGMVAKNNIRDLKIISQNESKNKLNFYDMQNLGFHYRLTDIHAALGISQLKKLDQFINKRKKFAMIYDKHFNKLKNLKILQKGKRANSANHLYVLLIDFKKIQISKHDLMRRLLYHGIGTQIHYIPVPFHSYYRKKTKIKINKIRSTSEYFEKALSIPLHYGLNERQQKRIINTFKKILS